MIGRSTVTTWWRRKSDRLVRISRELTDIARHEGPVVAGAALRYRVERFLKLRLLKVWKPPHVAARTVESPKSLAVDAHAPIKNGVLFVGYVEAGLGLGESLRGLIASTIDTGLPFGIFPFNVNVESRIIGPFHPERYDLGSRYEINVIEMAADQLPQLRAALGDERIQASYNILRTYWELPAAPSQWAPLLEWIDEIWAPNAFVAEAFRSIFPGRITIIPPCVEVGTPAGIERGAFGLRDDVFYFLFSFDYFSFPARKNPLGVLRAFQAAFARDDERVGLVIKSTGSKEHFPEVRAAIAHAARLDPRIVVMEKTLTRDEISGLIAACDSYVSLHRSEGFGLGMVESMSFAKPVIGTDFSGSTDFLSQATGYPVPCQLRSVRDGEYLYSEGQVWAEPDMAAAAQTMATVFSKPRKAAERGAAGREFMRLRYGRAAVGEAVVARVGEIMAMRKQGAFASSESRNAPQA